jgi:hypothetical protein
MPDRFFFSSLTSHEVKKIKSIDFQQQAMNERKEQAEKPGGTSIGQTFQVSLLQEKNLPLMMHPKVGRER